MQAHKSFSEKKQYPHKKSCQKTCTDKKNAVPLHDFSREVSGDQIPHRTANLELPLSYPQANFRQTEQNGGAGTVANTTRGVTIKTH